MDIIQQKVSAIIFDVDGVLVDTVSLHFRAWQKVFTEEGISFGREEYQKINGLPRDEGVRLMLGSATIPERIREIGDRKQAYYLGYLGEEPPAPLPGVMTLLVGLKKAGWRVAAASSSKNARRVLEAAGLAEYFDAIVTGNDFKKPKPDPEIFLTAARGLGVAPEESIVVEDAVNGIRAAKAGGFLSVAVANSETATALRDAGASAVVSSMSQLTMDSFFKQNVL